MANAPLTASAYGVVALSRAREMRTRIAFALVLMTTAWVFAPGIIPFLWFAAVLMAQGLDHAVARPLRRHPESAPSPRRRIAYTGSTVLSAVIYGSIAIYMWFYGGVAGHAFAMLAPAGSILHMSMRMDQSPRLLVPGWAPHAVLLICLPLASGLISPEADLVQMGVVSLGSGIFLAHVMAMLKGTRQVTEALHLARDEAEHERARAEAASA
ncbi:MAG: hypothetical protein ABI655_04860, partial [Phenylobacterium sp.]